MFVCSAGWRSCLEGSKVDDGADAVLGEDGFQRSNVHQITLHKRHLLASDFLHTRKRLYRKEKGEEETRRKQGGGVGRCTRAVSGDKT
jgi:hypothetical protein